MLSTINLNTKFGQAGSQNELIVLLIVFSQFKKTQNFKKIREKLRNSEKKIGENLRKFLGNFILNFGGSLCGFSK